jgi:DNA invertase Pin-like site-specific DNA recombinase
MTARPSVITVWHLERDTYVYARQSSQRQVNEHTGSTAVQRALAERARQWGVPESRIKVVDDDLGETGRIPNHRSGFERMLQAIRHGEVGIVLAHNDSRLARNLLDAIRFIEAAKRARIVFEIGGWLCDTSTMTLTELVRYYIQAMFAWFENENKTITLQASRLAKIEQGCAVSAPPLGYVRTVKGHWGLEPTPGVAEAHARLFELYRRLGSTTRVARHHHCHNLLFPRRVKGVIVWEPLSTLQISHVLRNPNYTPDYVFRQSRCERDEETGHLVRRRLPRSEWKVVENHHVGLVSREQFDVIQEKLAGNRLTRRPPMGGGDALLQGILWCRCGRRVKPKYDRKLKDGRRLPSYKCRVADRFTSQRCFWSAAEILDAPVVREVLATITGMTASDAEAAINEYQEEQRADEVTRTASLRQAEAAMKEAQRRYDAVDPAHRHVAATLEERLEKAKEHYEAIRRALAQQAAAPVVLLTREDTLELLALAREVEPLWHAASTTNEDRKRWIQTLVSRVTIIEATDEQITLEITWVGGVTSSHCVRAVRRQGIASAVRGLREQGLHDAEIIRTLKERGVTSRLGRPLSRSAVWKTLRDQGLTRGKTLRLAYERVRELTLLKWSGPAIVTELETHGPLRWKGMWTLPLVRTYQQHLRKGKVPRGVLPLPSDFALNNVWGTSPEVVALMKKFRQEGRSWADAAAELNHRKLRPAQAPTFTAGRCRSLWDFWRRNNRVSDATTEHAYGTSPEVVALVKRLRPQGRSWADIAAELNRRELRPAQAPTFTAQRCQALWSLWRRKDRASDATLEPSRNGKSRA